MKKFLSHNWLVHKINMQSVLCTLDYIEGDLLDIGCGKKPYLEVLNPFVKNYIGFEHPNTLHMNNKIDVLRDGCRLHFKNNSFDTVVSFQVLEHINEPNEMLAEIHRILKIDKYLILTTSFMWRVHEVPIDFYRYTRYGLNHLLEKAGLRFNYNLTRFGKSYLKYFLSPIFFLVQILSIIFDKFDRNESDTAGYTTIAKKITTKTQIIHGTGGTKTQKLFAH